MKKQEEVKTTLTILVISSEEQTLTQQQEAPLHHTPSSSLVLWSQGLRLRSQFQHSSPTKATKSHSSKDDWSSVVRDYQLYPCIPRNTNSQESDSKADRIIWTKSTSTSKYSSSLTTGRTFHCSVAQEIVDRLPVDLNQIIQESIISSPMSVMWMHTKPSYSQDFSYAITLMLRL